MPSFFDDRIPREVSHLNGFSGNPVERWTEARGEADLAAAFAHPEATVHLFHGDRALLRLDGARRTTNFARAEAEALGLDAASLLLLGVVGEAPRLAGLVASEPPADISAIDLRTLAMEAATDPAELAALGQARSYLFWHQTNGFCGRCGGALDVRKAGASRFCPHCEVETFPRVDPVVIMLAIDDDRCLLGRQARFAPGMYSALAGFLEPGETIEAAVRREVLEESGIAIGRVAYHSSQAWPFTSSLMIGCHAEAITTDVTPDASELEDCRWFPRDEVRLMLEGTHPDGLKAPFPLAIAHFLLRAFAEWE